MFVDRMNQLTRKPQLQVGVSSDGGRRKRHHAQQCNSESRYHWQSAFLNTSIENGPRSVLQLHPPKVGLESYCCLAAVLGEACFFFIDSRKRQLSPVISFSQWCVRRSNRAAVMRSPWKICCHSVSGRFVVQKQLDKTELSICDELGYLSFSRSGRCALRMFPTRKAHHQMKWYRCRWHTGPAQRFSHRERLKNASPVSVGRTDCPDRLCRMLIEFIALG